MAPAVTQPGVSLLLRILEEAWGKKAWHGTTLRGSIRGLTLEEALRRPAEGRHNVAELVLHAAYWKYSVRRRLALQKRGSFPLAGSNWFPADDGFTAEQWKKAVRILGAEHEALRSAVAGLQDSDLDRKPAGGGIWTMGQLVSGVAAHDLYHAGQIQLVKRLVRPE
ncbi:MAG: DinB family protein [Thermoanaerobaculia bacterium]